MPRPQKTGATEHAAAGIAAPGPTPSRDPFDIACIQAEEKLVKTTALKAQSEATELSPQQRAEARRAYQQAKAELSAKQKSDVEAVSRPQGPTPAQWQARLTAALRKMSYDQLLAVDESEWFKTLPRKGKDAALKLVSQALDDQLERQVYDVEGIEYDEDAEDEELPEETGVYAPAPADWTTEDDQQDYVVDPETGLLEEVESSWAT